MTLTFNSNWASSWEWIIFAFLSSTDHITTFTFLSSSDTSCCLLPFLVHFTVCRLRFAEFLRNIGKSCIWSRKYFSKVLIDHISCPRFAQIRYPHLHFPSQLVSRKLFLKDIAIFVYQRWLIYFKDLTEIRVFNFRWQIYVWEFECKPFQVCCPFYFGVMMSMDFGEPICWLNWI